MNADGELLVVTRNRDPAKGTWDLPGGFLDPGETYEQGLRRELREELNLDIFALRYFLLGTQRIRLWWRCILKQ